MTSPESTDDPTVVSTRDLNRSTLALHANTVFSSILGFAFLLVAARLFDRDEFGRDMALVSAMMLLAAIAETNLGMSLMRFLPQLGERSPGIVLRAYVLTGSIALVLSTLFVVIAPRASDSFDYLAHTWTLCLWFIVSTVCWNVFAVSDSVLTAIRKATWVPVKNSMYGVAKFVAMAVFAWLAIDHGVFLAWAVPLAILTIPFAVFVGRGPLRRHAQATPANNDEHSANVASVLSHRRDVVRYIGFDYLASIMGQISTTALPLVVVATLGNEANADFAVAFSIVTAVEQLALNAGVALTVEGSFDERAFARLLRHSFVRFGGLLLIAILIGIIGAPVVATLLGGGYGSDTTDVLRLLLVGMIAESVIILYESSARIRTKPHLIVFVTMSQAVITIVTALFLAEPMGLAGIGIAWIVGHTVVGLAVLPSLLRMMFPKAMRDVA